MRGTLSFLLLYFQHGIHAFSSINLDGSNPNNRPFERPHTIISNENIPSSATPPPEELYGHELPKWWEKAGTHESSTKTNEGFMKTHTDCSKEISQSDYQPQSSSTWWDNPGKSLHKRPQQTTQGMFQTQTDIAKEIARQEALLFHEQQQQQQNLEYYKSSQDNPPGQAMSHQSYTAVNEVLDSAQSQQATRQVQSYGSYTPPSQSMHHLQSQIQQPQPQSGYWQAESHQTTAQQDMLRTHSDIVQQERLLNENVRSTGQQWWDKPGHYDPSTATNEGNFQTQTEIEKERSREQDPQQRPSGNWWDRPGNHEDSFGFQTDTDRKRFISRKFGP